jgi:hypothetical protein
MAAHVVGARSRIRIGSASANLIALGSHAELKSLILPNRIPSTQRLGPSRVQRDFVSRGADANSTQA